MAQRIVEFKGVFDSSSIISTINSLQKNLSQLKLDNTSVKSFEKILESTKKQVVDLSTEISKGFSSESQVKTFTNHVDKLNQSLNQIAQKVSEVSVDFNNLNLNPSLQKQFESLKNSANVAFSTYESQLSQAQQKAEQLAKQLKLSLSEGESSAIANAINDEEELIRLKNEKLEILQKEREALKANQAASKDNLQQEQKKLQDLEKTKNEAVSKVTEASNIYEVKKGSDVSKGEKISAKANLDIATTDAKKAIKNYEAQKTKIKEIEQEINKTHTALTDNNTEINRTSRYYDALADKPIKLNKEAKQTTTEIQELKNELKQSADNIDAAVTKMNDFKKATAEATSESLQKNQKGLQNAGENLNSVREGADATAESLDRLNKQDSFFNNLKNRATAIFGLGSAFMYLNQFLRESWQTIKELDAAFTEIAIVTNKTNEQLWQSFNTYNDIAQRLGVTTTEAIQTSALYYQQGLQTADVMTLTEETIKMARIAGMDFAEATDRMTAALRGFKLEMSEASTVNDVFSALAAKAAVDTDELSYALTKTASIAESAGMELETTSAFLTQMINYVTCTRVA